MTKTGLVIVAAVCVCFSLLSILFVDRPLAEWVRHSGIESMWIFTEGTKLLDTICARDVWRFLLGSVIVGVGVVALAVRGWRRLAPVLLFTGWVHLTSYFTALVVKSLFGRLRPAQLFESQTWDASWFAGGGSFPSGHVAYYVSLFLPLMVVFPRWRRRLIVIPAFIVIARINENDHFLSDTTGSIALVALITAGLMAVMKRWLPRKPSQTSNESDKIRQATTAA